MKLTKFLISRTRGVFTKLLRGFESSIKKKVRSHWKLSVILLTSQLFPNEDLHEIEILQYLKNFKCCNVQML